MAAPAEATFAATSGGTLLASGWASAYSSCASGGLPGAGKGIGFGNGNGNGWRGPCSWTTFTGNWGGWGVNWFGFAHDDDCSTTAGGPLTTVTPPSGVSAVITGTASPSLGATVTTTINGQTLTGTIFSAQGQVLPTASGTVSAVARNGGMHINNVRMGAFAKIVVALLTAACML